MFLIISIFLVIKFVPLSKKNKNKTCIVFAPVVTTDIL